MVVMDPFLWNLYQKLKRKSVGWAVLETMKQQHALSSLQSETAWLGSDCKCLFTFATTHNLKEPEKD